MSNGRRQPSRGGTSRMTRECQVRICERLGVKFPGPTRQSRQTNTSDEFAGCPPLIASPSQFIFVGCERAIIAQASKFLPPFLVDGDLIAILVKLQYIRADALRRRCDARHP